MLRLLGYLFLLLILIILGSGYYLYSDYQKFLKTPIKMVDSSQYFEVHSGDGVRKIAERFEKENIILGYGLDFRQQKAKYYFEIYARFLEKATNIHAGEYQLVDNMLPKDLLELFNSGRVVEHHITFLEGWSFAQVISRIRENENIKQTLDGLSNIEIMRKLDQPDLHYEGEFFPDTYNFANRTKDITILKIAFDKMQKELNETWDSRDKNSFLKNPYELLILASIIEREAGSDEEMSKISGVFHKRMEKNMALQTDPTVIYGMGKKYKGRLLYKDLRKDTPYNTYTRKGLPPTPISMPGNSALYAAGHPDNSDYLFFVATGKGGHTFTKTYKEHLQAVKKYRAQKQKEDSQ